MQNKLDAISYQSMSLRLLKVVASVERVQPRLEEKLGPLSVAENNVVVHQARLVLRQNEVNMIPAEVLIRLDDAVWRHNRLARNHERLHRLGLQDQILERLFRVHNVGILIEVPDEFAVGELGQRSAHGHQF